MKMVCHYSEACKNTKNGVLTAVLSIAGWLNYMVSLIMDVLTIYFVITDTEQLHEFNNGQA